MLDAIDSSLGGILTYTVVFVFCAIASALLYKWRKGRDEPERERHWLEKPSQDDSEADVGSQTNGSSDEQTPIDADQAKDKSEE